VVVSFSGERYNMKPYTDVAIDENCFIREFNPIDADNEDYVWHRDREDREITILEGNGWQFQFDNELPFYLNKGDKFFIPKMIYHRIIPGNDLLRILIDEKSIHKNS
jgi:hypothetical protein